MDAKITQPIPDSKIGRPSSLNWLVGPKVAQNGHQEAILGAQKLVSLADAARGVRREA